VKSFEVVKETAIIGSWGLGIMAMNPAVFQITASRLPSDLRCVTRLKVGGFS